VTVYADHAVRNTDTYLSQKQMTSSVYLDNVTLGLYHDRLAKMPHAIAVRLRWYGLDPNAGVVFVERKTHRESWTGDESVKERFTLPPTLVVPFLQGTHTWEMEEARLYEGTALRGSQIQAHAVLPLTLVTVRTDYPDCLIVRITKD
jgi:SPX domain protein involved in polyphosphate accumulation